MKTWFFLLAFFANEALAQITDPAVSALTWRIRVNSAYPQPTNWQGSVRERTMLDSLITANVDKAENTREMGVGYLKHGDYDGAVHYYERACQLNPKHHGYVGWVYLEYIRDYGRALHHLNQYDSLTANFDDQIGDNPVSILRGRAYSQLGRYAEAITQYSVAITNIEKKVGAEWVNYLYFIARGVAYLKSNQIVFALQDFDRAVVNNPQSAMAHYHRGLVLAAAGRLTEARTAYTDAQFFLRTKPIERDVYFEHFDAVYEVQIDDALKTLKP